MSKHILGIDVGGTGVKAAVVNTKKGHLVTEKIKYATPQPSYPSEVMKVINQLIDDFEWRGKKMGCGFPSIIKHDMIFSAANIDNSWMHVDLRALFNEADLHRISFINDADAAGVAEMTFGAGQDRDGTVLMLTLGTGIGSGLFINGHLVPNTEMGHLEHGESIWEHYASNSARERKELSWEVWGNKLNDYLNHVNFILNPDVIILGGGVSKKFEKFKDFLDVEDVELYPAEMLNNAGIIGAALHARKTLHDTI